MTSASKAMAGKIANPTNDIQGLFLPEGGSMLANASNGLSAAGVTSGKVRMLGTGLWDERSTSNLKLIVGGWYAGVSPNLIARFAERYQQAANEPKTILWYDSGHSRTPEMIRDQVEWLAQYIGIDPDRFFQ